MWHRDTNTAGHRGAVGTMETQDNHSDDELQPFILGSKATDDEGGRGRKKRAHRAMAKLYGPAAKALFCFALFIIAYICLIFGFPQDWDPRPFLFHLKVPKTGSSSLDFTLGMYTFMRPWNRCICKTLFTDFFHFDWSYIESVEKSDHPRVVASFRDPVDRAMSHFSYIQLQDFTRHLRMRNQSFSEFIRDPLSLMEAEEVWRDGMAGVAWLTGNTRSDGWVVRGPDSLSYLERAERLHRNITETCLLAARRLEQLAWFGLLEEPVRSGRMLSDYLGRWATIQSRFNTNTKKRRISLGADERAFVESLMPMDVWLYKYAQRLFERRWAHLVLGHEFVLPHMPPFPPQRKVNLLPSGNVLVTSGYAG